MQRATEIYLLFFASIHLLYFGFSGYSHIFEAKILTFCTINALYFSFAAFIFILIIKRHGSITYTLKRRPAPAQFCVLLYLLLTVISGLLSSHFPYTFIGISRFEGILTISIYCISFLLISAFPCKVKTAFTVFSFGTMLFAAVCVIQLFGYNIFSLYPDGMSFYDAGIKYTTAFLGTIGNTNLCGAFICLALPLLTTALIKAKSKARFLLLIPISLLLFTVIKMGVSSAILGLSFGLIISIPLFLKFGKKAVAIYFSSIITAALLLLIITYFYPPKSGLLYEVSMILHGNISDSFGSGRIRIWKNVLSEIPDSPLLGKGPDVMQSENFTPFVRYYPALGRNMTASIDVAHNELLNILYHQGILGLSAYLGFIFFVLRSWWKNRQDTVVLALGIAIICYLVQSLFTFSMCLTAPYFWICAGLLHGLSNRKEHTRQ